MRAVSACSPICKILSLHLVKGDKGDACLQVALKPLEIQAQLSILEIKDHGVIHVGAQVMILFLRLWRGNSLDFESGVTFQ